LFYPVTYFGESGCHLLNAGHGVYFAVHSESGQLSLLPSVGWEMSSHLWAVWWRPIVADWDGGMSAGCTADPFVC